VTGTIFTYMHSQPSIRIRPATPQDANFILKCLSVAFAPFKGDYTPDAFTDTVLTEETVLGRLRGMRVLVALAGDKIVGTVAGGTDQATREGHLRGMAVLPEWHGRGVAALLLKEIEAWLRSRGCKRITLDTTLPLQIAMRFYEKNGYRRSGTVRNFFGMRSVEYAKEI